MARSRVLNPGFFTNEDLLELSLEARVLFAGLWCLADRKGRLEDRPKRIKIELFPGDNYDVDNLLQALLNKGFIHRYAAPGMNLIHVKTFLKYQRPHPREAQSVLPECPCETEVENLGLSKDEPRHIQGDAKVFGLGSPRTLGSPKTDEDGQTGAGAPKRSPSRKPPFEELTKEERLELLDKWLPRLPDASERIDLALEHEQHWKYPTGQKRYVDNWLRGDWERKTANGHQLRTNPQPNHRMAGTSTGSERVPDMVIGD